MRKLTVEVVPNDATREEMRPLFEDIYSYEILEILKVDHEAGMCVDLIQCDLREHLSIDELASIGKMEILNVLKSVGNRHTCLVKYYEEEDHKDLFDEFDLDLIYTTPNYMSEDRIISSCMGGQRDLSRFVEVIRTRVGRIVGMTFKRAVYTRQDILSVLTEKQREVIAAAHRFGYYDYPKRITSQRLADRVNISKGTLVEHLRKAEGRILSEILTGQPS